jgi:hypothetical protein
MHARASDGEVGITLTASEAVVLFEWLRTHGAEAPVSERAEQRVLWDLLAVLEKALVDPFRPDYRAVLEAARANVRDR